MFGELDMVSKMCLIWLGQIWFRGCSLILLDLVELAAIVGSAWL